MTKLDILRIDSSTWVGKKNKRCNGSHQDPKHYDISGECLLSAPNLDTLSLRLRMIPPSWAPMINVNSICKTLRIVFQVNFCCSEIGSLTWSCISLGSDSPESWASIPLSVAPSSNFRNTRTGRWMLRGLFHQKMNITTLVAAYASVTISRWMTGRCSTDHPMHCITNHDVWITESNLASQSLSPVLDFRFGRHDEWVDTIAHKVVCA